MGGSVGRPVGLSVASPSFIRLYLFCADPLQLQRERRVARTARPASQRASQLLLGAKERTKGEGEKGFLMRNEEPSVASRGGEGRRDDSELRGCKMCGTRPRIRLSLHAGGQADVRNGIGSLSLTRRKIKCPQSDL